MLLLGFLRLVGWSSLAVHSFVAYLLSRLTTQAGLGDLDSTVSATVPSLI